MAGAERAKLAHGRYVAALERRHERFDAAPGSGTGLTARSTFRVELQLLRLLDQLRDHLEHDWADTSGVPSPQQLLNELSADQMNATRERLKAIDAAVERAAEALVDCLEDEDLLNYMDTRYSVTEIMTNTLELLDRLTESQAGQDYLDRSLDPQTFDGPLPLVHPDRLQPLLAASPVAVDLDVGNGPQLGADPNRYGEIDPTVDTTPDPEWMTRRAVQVHAAFTAQVVPLVAAARLQHLDNAGDAVAALTEASLQRLYPAEIFTQAGNTQDVIAAARGHEQSNPNYFPTQQIAAHIGMLLDAADAFAALDRYARDPDGDRSLENLASGVLSSLQLASKLMDDYGGLGRAGKTRLKRGTAWLGVAAFAMDLVVTRRELRTAQRTGDTAVARGHMLVLAGGAVTTLTTFAIAYGWMAATGPVGITFLAAGTLLILTGEIVKVTLGKHPFQRLAHTCYFGLARANDDRDSLPEFGDPDYGFFDDDGDHLPRQIDGVHSVLRPLGFNARQSQVIANRVEWSITFHQLDGPEPRLPDGFTAGVRAPAGPGQSAGPHAQLSETEGGVHQLMETGRLVTGYSTPSRRWIELWVTLPQAGPRPVTLYDYTREPWKPL